MGALGSTVQGLVEEVGFETGVKNSCYRTCEWSLTNQSGRSYVDVTFVMPRLHQDTCRPETCIPYEELVSGYIYDKLATVLSPIQETC